MANEALNLRHSLFLSGGGISWQACVGVNEREGNEV